MSPPSDPPYYIMVSHSPLLNSAGAAPSSTTFSHPTIEYHYADDSPRSLLPQTPGEHVLVIDFDPNKGTDPVVKSLSSDLAVIGLKVTEAPGAGAAGDGMPKNHAMYVLETTTIQEEIIEEDEFQSAHAILARFKQRNAILRQVLEHPRSDSQDEIIQLPSLSTSPSQF